MSIIIPDSIIRSHRKTITLHITPEGKLLVHAPKFLPQLFIDRFIDEKKEWIQKKITEVGVRPQAKDRSFIEGEKILYLGKELELHFTDGITISVKDSYFLFPKVMLVRAKKELENWYIVQAKKVITQRVEYHAEHMHAQYKNIFFSDTKSKWGTCFHDNTLQFNWRLIMAPLLVIDYVVIHELAHTTEKNHSRDFWNRVRLFTPAYRQHQKWLKDHGHLLLV